MFEQYVENPVWATGDQIKVNVLRMGKDMNLFMAEETING